MVDRPAIAPRYEKALQPAVLARLRNLLHRMNPSMVLLWRLGLGPTFGMWPSLFGRILVLAHTGRRTGTTYRTPLNYAPVGDSLYCLAGFGPSTDWYRNVLAQSNVEVWLPNGRWAATAIDASHDPDRVDRMREVLIASGFAARAIGLDPGRMSDQEVEAATRSYRLVRIELLERRSPGPGDLSWVWVVPIMAYVAHARRRRRRQRKLSGMWPA